MKTMKKKRWVYSVCLLLIMPGLTACAMKEQAPGYTEINRLPSLDGGLQSPYGPQSPVMQDVYDRSIPEEVYSADS